MTTKTKTTKELTFKQEDFDIIFEGQDGRCYLTGRKMTPFNTRLGEIDPYKSEITDISNFCLVHKDIVSLTKKITTEEIIQFAAEIIDYRGEELGYKLETIKPRKPNEKRIKNLARDLTPDEIVLLAASIIDSQGKDLGYELKKKKGGKE